MDDADLIPGSEERIDPSPQFAARVMAAVRKEAMMPPPLPFPWRRVAIGAGIGAAASTALATSPTATSAAANTLTELSRATGAIDPVFLWALIGTTAFTLGIVQFTVWIVRRGT